MKTKTTLMLAQPYPGDEHYNMTYIHPELRFDVVQHTNQRQYMINDRATDFSISIPKSHLANPKFDISQWYAKRWIKALNLKCLNTHSDPIDSTIDIVAIKLLTDGIASSYPCTNLDLDPEDRFYVYLSGYGSSEYVINDIDLEVFPQLPKAWLEEPSFNLIG